jgi:hypothetical protein
MGAALLHADRRTDMTKLTGAFRDLCERAFKTEDNPVLDIRLAEDNPVLDIRLA